MRITYLRLKNFAPIYAGCGIDDLVLSNAELTNRLDSSPVILIMGKNGSGKTALLSQLQPFPYVGNLDNRSSLDLIIPNKDGLKQLIIQDKEDTYDIRHHYKLINGKRKVSSYISLNGMELNPSGSITKFYELMGTTFNLNNSFLRIIRLGSNVNSLVSMKASERKEFISEFLTDLDIYDKALKTINEKYKSSKKTISVLSALLDKVPDENSIKEKKKSVGKELTELKSNLKLLEEYQENTKKRYDKYSSIVSREDTILNNYKTIEEFNKMEIHNSKELYSQWQEANKQLQQYQSKYDVLKYKLNTISNQCQDYKNKINDINNRLGLIEFTKDTNLLAKKRKEVVKEIDELLAEGEIEFKVSSNTAYLDLVNSDLEEITELAMGLVDSMPNTIRNIKKLFDKNMHEGINPIDVPIVLNDYADKKLKVFGKLAGVSTSKTSQRIFYIPRECTSFNKCPFYKEYVSNKTASTKIESVENQIDEVLEMKRFVNVISMIYSKINTLHALQAKNIANVCINYIRHGEVLASILNLKVESNKNLNQLIKFIACDRDMILRINKVDELKTALDDIDKEIFCSKETEEAKSELAALKLEFDKANEEYLDIKDLISKVNEKIDEYSDIITKLDKDISIINTYNDNKEKIDLYNSEYEEYLEAKEKIKKTINDLKTIESEISFANMVINQKESEYAKILSDQETRKRVEEKIEQEESIFEDINSIKDSLSSTKGIPLIFIKIYLKNIQLIANNILSDLFGDELYLNDFIINEKEFSIPYSINGVEVRDVEYASQGQKSAIILALSFALMYQYMSKYNIILIDELDAPLYKEIKEKFIYVLEKQLQKMNCEQCFLISHNPSMEASAGTVIKILDNAVNEFGGKDNEWI